MLYKENQNYKILDANSLKFLAMFFMLLDHLWATIIPGNQWMTYLGRMAFPIFAFQISEGFVHTRDFGKYAKRLLVFALISEIPFNLFYSSSFIYPFHQNTIFTLFLGLLAINSIHKFKQNRGVKYLILSMVTLVLTSLAGGLFFTDYGTLGVLTVVAFYLFRDFPYHRILQLIAMVLLNLVFFTGMYIPINIFGYDFEFTTQGFAVLALIPIWLYNGKKGNNSPLLKYSIYIFYPVHLLVIYLIFRFI